MRESARYAWWLLIFFFAFIIIANILLFWTRFLDPAARSLRSSSAPRTIDLQVQYALAMEQIGLGRQATERLWSDLFKELDKALAPYEATLYRAILESALGKGDSRAALQRLPDLPSDRLTPAERRWQAALWQRALREPLRPEQVPALLDTLPDAPTPLATALLKLALYRRAGDTAQADAARAAIQNNASRLLLAIFGVMSAAAFAGAIGLVVIIVYIVQMPKLPPRPAPDESPFVYDPLLWALVVFLLVLLNAPTVDFLLRDLKLDASDALYLLAVLLPLMFLASLRTQPGALGQIRWFQPGFWKQVGAALGAYAAYIPFLAVLLVLTIAISPALPAEQTNPIGERLDADASVWQWLWTFTQAAVLAPIIEEFLFRGALFKVLWQRTGRVWLSAFVSGYLFAIIHPQFLGGMLPLTVFGAILAIVYAHTRSLLPCILIHALHNGLIVAVMWSVLG
ncbi:MAG: CPBP family intramembrane metalloprotease [Fimbriimonadales bacterium]|nr:CPBP family intramembrane metalloprotease [Fimbriimonadales bacterium]